MTQPPSEQDPPLPQGATDAPGGELRSRVSYNASTRLVGRVAGALLSLVALRLITHDFGPERWGEVVAASAFANLFVGLCDFGLTRIVSREIATPGSEDRTIYGGGLLAGLLVSCLAMMVMTLADFAVYASHPSLRSFTLVLVVSLPPNAAWVLSGAVLIAKARNDARGVIDVTSSLFLLGAAGTTVAAALGVAGYLWLTVAADVATAALGLLIARHYVRADFRSGRHRVGELIRRAAPLGLSQALMSVAVQVDVVLLSLLVPLATVGTFGVALQLAVFGTAIPPMLTAAILPKFVDGTFERRQRLAQRAFDVLASGGAAIPLAAIVFARPAIMLVAGRRFASGATPLILLSFYAALSCPAAVFMDGLVYLKAERAVLRITLVATIAILAVAGSTIPFFAAKAAAIALVTGAAVVVVSSATAFRRAAGFGVSLGNSARFVAISALLIGVYLLLHFAAGYVPRGGWLLFPEMLVVLGLYSVLVFGAWRRFGGHDLVGS
jgi:O-antigen/teichoic acid export membrane protein